MSALSRIRRPGPAVLGREETGSRSRPRRGAPRTRPGDQDRAPCLGEVHAITNLAIVGGRQV
jgi:hypothetical protein